MKLAIIIPAFNAEDTIKRAILSVDTKSDYEVICAVSYTHLRAHET